MVYHFEFQSDSYLGFFFRVQVQSQESAGVMHYLSGGAWDPHDINAVAATRESSIQFWDLRTMKYVFALAFFLFVKQGQHGFSNLISQILM